MFLFCKLGGWCVVGSLLSLRLWVSAKLGWSPQTSGARFFLPAFQRGMLDRILDGFLAELRTWVYFWTATWMGGGFQTNLSIHPGEGTGIADTMHSSAFGIWIINCMTRFCLLVSFLSCAKVGTQDLMHANTHPDIEIHSHFLVFNKAICFTIFCV